MSIEESAEKVLVKTSQKKSTPRKRKSSRKKVAKTSSATAVVVRLSQETRNKMIEEAAYFIAQRRGFEPGHDVEDWLKAEAQIDAKELVAGR